MRSTLLSLLLVVLICAYCPVGYAEYADPVLKVLLLRTSKSVSLSSKTSMFVNGVRLTGRRSNWVKIKSRANGQVQLDTDLMVNGSAYFRSEGPIAVKKGRANTRRYEGIIEITAIDHEIYVINHIQTETYLEGVLNAEISTNWPIEVVKAQSIISRTFALYQRERRKNDNWHLSADFNDQVYKGIDIADDRGRFAIEATSGIVVCHQGRLAQTFYHSNSGGMTEDPGNLWQVSLPYLRVKAVPFGKSDPRYRWAITLSARELAELLLKSGISIQNIDDIVITRRNTSNRVHELLVVGDTENRISGNHFRKMAGYRRVKSLLFDIEKHSDGFYVSGTGNGHGVGLSQWAAKEMAESGYQYLDILRFFYNDIDLRRYEE